MDEQILERHNSIPDGSWDSDSRDSVDERRAPDASDVVSRNDGSSRVLESRRETERRRRKHEVAFSAYPRAITWLGIWITVIMIFGNLTGKV